MDEYDRRQSPRQRQEDIINVWLIPDDLAGRKNSSDITPGKTVNQSDNGLFIEIGRELQPGSNVRIKMDVPHGHHPEEAYYIRDGLVIRCEKFGDAVCRFGVGIKILRKVVQTRVLTSRFK